MRSKLRLFSFPLTLLALATAFLMCRNLFSTYVDPEIVFYTQFCKNKLAWSQKMTREHGKKVVIYGGSSCAFSIMGMRMLDLHGMPTVNMGLEAPLGATILTNWTLGEVHTGDTLIIALEPILLSGDSEMPASACKLSLALGHPAWVYKPWQAPFFPALGATLRSNTGWKWLLLVPDSIYKNKTKWPYAINNTDASGWQTTERHKEMSEMPNPGGRLSPDSKKLLCWTRQWCDRNGVRVAYSLPWYCRTGKTAMDLQKNNLSLLKEIAEILPVLKDARLGIYPERENFIDTLYHLDEKGAALRTDELARQIKAWDVWTPGELDAWGMEHLSEEKTR